MKPDGWHFNRSQHTYERWVDGKIIYRCTAEAWCEFLEGHIRKLHTPVPIGSSKHLMCVHCSSLGPNRILWPCPTIRTIEGY